MRVVRWLVAAVLVGALGRQMTGAEKPSEEYVSAMRDLDAIKQALTRPGAPADFAAVEKLAARAEASFKVAVLYWDARKVDDAFRLAALGVKTAQDTGIAAEYSSEEGVVVGVEEMLATCDACHKAHREQMPDGTFLIK